MIERPIIFSPPMVIAQREGRKTNTRRIVKYEFTHGCMTGDCPHDTQTECNTALLEYARTECPYGIAGDRLWVRENYCFDSFEEVGIDDWFARVRYPADGQVRRIYQCDAPPNVGFWPGAAIRKYEGKLRPSIFMYRWASRILLEITDVRIERVQSISPEDAIAEGMRIHENPECGVGVGRYMYTAFPGEHSKWDLDPVTAYRNLWESINGTGSWDRNPWVWSIYFKEVQP